VNWTEFGSPVTKAPAGVLDGKTIRRHGESPEFWDEIKETEFTNHGGKPAGSVSKQTDFVVAVKKAEAARQGRELG